MTEAEKKSAQTQRAIGELDKIVWSHNRHLVNMMRHNEDLDNRGRRNNLRVRGVPEEIEAEQIPLALAAIFNSLLGRPKEATIHLVRAHRALRPRPQNNSSPRDIICCLVDFGLKEQILQKARGQDEILFNTSKIELYQDPSSVTLQQNC